MGAILACAHLGWARCAVLRQDGGEQRAARPTASRVGESRCSRSPARRRSPTRRAIASAPGGTRSRTSSGTRSCPPSATPPSRPVTGPAAAGRSPPRSGPRRGRRRAQKGLAAAAPKVEQAVDAVVAQDRRRPRQAGRRRAAPAGRRDQRGDRAGRRGPDEADLARLGRGRGAQGRRRGQAEEAPRPQAARCSAAWLAAGGRGVRGVQAAGPRTTRGRRRRATSRRAGRRRVDAGSSTCRRGGRGRAAAEARSTWPPARRGHRLRRLGDSRPRCERRLERRCRDDRADLGSGEGQADAPDGDQPGKITPSAAAKQRQGPRRRLTRYPAPCSPPARCSRCDGDLGPFSAPIHRQPGSTALGSGVCGRPS